MILLDTHSWIWLRSDPKRIPLRAALSIQRASRLCVSSMSCWEIATLVRRGRIALDRELEPWLVHALEAEPPIEAISVSPSIATKAGSLDDGFPGDPADRIIYATATSLDLNLVTKDDHLRRFAPDRTIWD